MAVRVAEVGRQVNWRRILDPYGIVVNHVLHKRVRPKKHMGNACRLDVVFGLGMLPWKHCFAPARRELHNPPNARRDLACGPTL
jgi:hypothetical protein